MKNVTIIVLVLLVVLGFTGVTSYNSIVDLQEKTAGSYADVEAQLQRRADLIPNLVSAVKGSMAHEQSLIDSVASTREKLLSAGSAQEMAAASSELDDALSRLMALAESCPELMADGGFVQLCDELAGTENRVAVARRDYNAAARDYNTQIRRFPEKLLADLFGFEPAVYFEASEGSREAPDVSF